MLRCSAKSTASGGAEGAWRGSGVQCCDKKAMWQRTDAASKQKYFSGCYECIELPAVRLSAEIASEAIAQQLENEQAVDVAPMKRKTQKEATLLLLVAGGQMGALMSCISLHPKCWRQARWIGDRRAAKLRAGSRLQMDRQSRYRVTPLLPVQRPDGASGGYGLSIELHCTYNAMNRRNGLALAACAQREERK